MNERSRIQGGLICAGTILVALLFLGGLLSNSWWSVAIPVGILLAFVLGLTFWVGWTIMTVELEEDIPDEPKIDEKDPKGPEAT